MLNRQSKRIAICGITTALGVVVMLLGNVLGLGMYLAPMLVGLCLTAIGKQWGTKYQILLWIAIGVLSLITVSNPEQNLIFICLFGWYPILRPRLRRLSVCIQIILKLTLFNAIVISVEALLMLVLVPEHLGNAMLVLLLVLGNVTFLVYDFAIPRFEMIVTKYLEKFL